LRQLSKTAQTTAQLSTCRTLSPHVDEVLWVLHRLGIHSECKADGVEAVRLASPVFPDHHRELVERADVVPDMVGLESVTISKRSRIE
jgi:hypothetical protein